MPGYEKAKLLEIDASDPPNVIATIPLQFNPQSLRLALANNLGPQETRGQLPRQYLGKTSTSLSFDLQFDTSDEGTTDEPVSVRTRTADVERFVLPKEEKGKKDKPPKARFVWNELQLDGIIESLSIDFDLFASNGVPLRAKMSVTMTEQDAKYQALKGRSGNAPSGSTGPGSFGVSAGLSIGASIGGGIGVSAGVGISLGAGVSASASATDSTRVALAGESAAEFAVRAGLDPTAWRGVTTGLSSTLSLTGGAEVDFNSSLSAGAGLGVSLGVETGTSSSLEATFGLDARAAVPTPAGVALGGVGTSSGFSLSSAGGVKAAIDAVNILKADGASSATKDAFGAAAASSGSSSQSLPSATPAAPDQTRTPLQRSGLPSATVQAATPAAPAPPEADPRAVSFGFGVPLRARITGAADARRGQLGGQIPLRVHARGTDVLTPAPDPTAAPWTHLPVDAARDAADAVQRTRNPTRPCGCMGPCAHRGVQ